MLKEPTWVCDVCLREKVNDGFPNDWFRVEIMRGSYFHNDEGKDDFVLDKDCCSEKCLRATIRTYLEG